MGPLQVLTIRLREDSEVIAMNIYFVSVEQLI